MFLRYRADVVGVMVFDLLWDAIGFDLQILCDHLPDFRSCLQCDLIEWTIDRDIYNPVCDPLHRTQISQPALSPCPSDKLQIPLDHPDWLILAQHGPFPAHWLKIHVVDCLKKTLETHFGRRVPCAPHRGCLGGPMFS